MKLKKYLKQILCGAVAFSIAAYVPAAGVVSAAAEEGGDSAEVTLAADTPAYKNQDLSFEERAADLVSRMTLEEKVSQTGRSAAAISRLGVQSYNYWSEGIHGVARQGNATSFPSSLSMSNTWNRTLMRETSDITSTEARGKNSNKNLSYWNPTINMARDPRWGRNEESYGEDPYLTAQIGGASVEGMQGDNEKYLKTIATLKHFAANNCEGERQTGTSVMNEKTLREYYLRAFEDITESANPASVMSSYNAITMKRNGETVMDYIAASANKYLLTDMLKRTWGFTGYVVGDCGAWANLYGRQPLKHKLFPNVPVDDVTAEMVVSKAFNAGNSLDCGNMAQSDSTVKSVKEGWMSEDTLDRAVYELFLARMKTGEFDDASKVPYRSIKSSVIEAPEHAEKAEQAAEESWVLLENRDNTLPLKNSVSNIAVVGNLADEVVLGDYSADSTKYSVSPFAGISSEIKKVNSSAQVNLVGNVSDSTPLFNIKTVKFTLKDGKTRIIDLSKAENVRGMTRSGSEFINITKTGQAVIRSVDFSNVDKVQIEAASLPGMPTTNVSIGYGSANQPVSDIIIQTTANKDTYAVNEVTYTGADGGYNGTADMFITVSASADFEVANYKDSLDAADYIIAYAGTTTADSKESNDRGAIDLPASQAHVQKICDAYPEKTIVIMSTVGQINVEPFKDKCKAMLWTSYNGQTQGTALGKVLTGVVNPSGKITTTWYKSEDLDKMPIGSEREKIDNIDYNFTNYEIAQGDNYPGRTYQYYNGSAVYPFGYGTSYTTFDYSNIYIDKTTADANDTVTVTADIRNTGSVDGAEVVQLYVTVLGADGKKLPLKQLKGFEKVSVKAGETKTVEFKLNLADVNFFDETTQQNYVVPGEWTIKVGSSSDDQNALAGKLNVSGTLSNAVKRVKAVPTGVTVIGAKGTDGSVAPASVINADASVTLENDKLISGGFAAAGITVTYASEDESIAKVDENGTVIAGNTAGTTMITVTAAQNGKTVTDSFPVVMQTVNRVKPEVTQQYLENLDNMFKLYPQVAYTAENWTKMQTAYNTAKTAIETELLEANLPAILSGAQAQFNAVEQISLTEKYVLQTKKQGVIEDGVIDYSVDGIGAYTAGETEISGTITKDSPAKIELEALNGTGKVSGGLLWKVEKLDGSGRKAADVNPDTGVLTLYENGIFKVSANNYKSQEFGAMTVYANLQIEGESADAGNGAKLDDAKAGSSGGLCVGSSSTKWIRYDGVKLDGVAEVTLRVSQKNAASKINVSLTPNDNWVFATGLAPATGEWTNWQEVTLPVNDSVLNKTKTDQNGCTSIYIQTNGANLDYIKLTHQGGALDVTNLEDGKISVKTPYDSGTLIGAVYGSGGVVQKVQTAPINGEETELSGFAAGEKAEIFAWDGVGTMKPLADGKTTHVYNQPQEKQNLVIYNFSDPQFDSFFETSDGSHLDSGLGLEGYGRWDTETKTKTSKYNGKTYTFTRGAKGGSGNIESKTKYFYFTPDADGVVTAFFDASPDRKVMIQQGDKIVEKYGTASGTITQIEAPVKANETVYVYGGGSNKQIYGIFFEGGKEYIEPTQTPIPTATPTPEPLPDITYNQKIEFEDFTKSWADSGMTKSDVAGASGGKVVDNTRNNDTFYFGERSMDNLAVINLRAGTKETGVVSVEFYAVDVSGIDINTASKDAVSKLLTSANSLGKTNLIASTSSWNDFKDNIIRVKSAKTGNLGLFMKTTTTGKYCGNFDYADLMYSDEVKTAAANDGYFAENIDSTEIEKTVDWNGALTAVVKNTETGRRDVAISPMGKIWSIITPSEFAQIDVDINAEDIVINDIEAVGDQLYVACDGGLLITMISCSKCSKLQKVCDFDIKSISSADENLVLTGGDNEAIVALKDARQNNIKADAALELASAGAVLVDVRSAEEFAQKSYPGSVNVPVDEFETWLETQEKDAVMIVYCSAGGRAERAVKAALDMGFVSVYNLGSIDELM